MWGVGSLCGMVDCAGSVWVVVGMLLVQDPASRAEICHPAPGQWGDGARPAVHCLVGAKNKACPCRYSAVLRYMCGQASVCQSNSGRLLIRKVRRTA